MEVTNSTTLKATDVVGKVPMVTLAWGNFQGVAYKNQNLKMTNIVFLLILQASHSIHSIYDIPEKIRLSLENTWTVAPLWLHWDSCLHRCHSQEGPQKIDWWMMTIPVALWCCCCCWIGWFLPSLLAGEQTAAPHLSPVGRCWVNAQEQLYQSDFKLNSQHTYPEMSLLSIIQKVMLGKLQPMMVRLT